MWWVAAIALWSFVDSVIFGDDFSVWSIVSAIASLYIYNAVAPFIHVIICNYRKVPYHGEAGTDRRGSSGAGSS